MADSQLTDRELDVRPLAKPDKHPTIFAAYSELAVGGSFVLVNDHDPKHLHDEFETEHPGSFGWDYLAREPRNWQIRITKLTSTPLPRVLLNTARLEDGEGAAVVAGAAWKLAVRQRDLDSNLIALPPGGGIDMHDGPNLDVLIHVTAGTGQLRTEVGVVELEPGALAWLPRGSRRQFFAGPDGLHYLSVHQRRQALALEPLPRATG
ncbi:MAG TPA: DUF2249 domain-containing protein [Sporichthya sp.]|nr:DUF2249 domain-containing protein [Sporichthya sp.]